MIGHHVRPRGGAAGDADAHASLTWGPGPHPRLFFSTRGGLGGLPEEVRKGKGLGPGSPPGPPSAACVYRVTEAIFLYHAGAGIVTPEGLCLSECL